MADTQQQTLVEFLTSENTPLLPHRPSPSTPNEVLIHVYDMSSWNNYVHWCGLGAYHSGTEVFGKEHAYGYFDGDDETGVYKTEPFMATEWATYRTTVSMGRISKSKSQVKSIIQQVAAAFQGRDYDLLTQNCNHFTVHLCQALLERDPPRWINQLARIGKRVECCLPVRLKEIHILAAEQEQHEKAERTGDDSPHLSIATPTA